MLPDGASQYAVAPPSISIWSYDEKSGFWLEEGGATLQNMPNGPTYVGTTSHFSTLNTDVAQSGAATCIRVPLNSSLTGGLTVRVHIPTAPSYKHVQELVLNSDQYHAIYRLPTATNIS